MERAERAERILEAAAELLLAWGYRRVTIDEIARRAKVGKGTVYLHWKTKDALFLAVLVKEQFHSQRRRLQRMRDDPLEILPGRHAGGIFREFLGQPVLRALYTDDSDLLGRLNDIAKKEFAQLIAEGDRVLCRHLEVLREHGLVRDDADIRHQQYTLMATLIGFFTSEGMLADRAPDTPEVRADMLTQMVRSALEAPDPDLVRATAAAAAAPKVIALYENMAELSEQEMRRQLRS
ncbi:TetR/AcrR family transcriptional regulator [Streptomyces natalensis]|uniref:TetR family transcriptional regulator n=1 Tax=Streptomyces natalensis ATCC 27448 TaxID=1240678 RepID=A0A0D7CF67_9ACTN|nr:TetR/AcrR family transcriptional regulator [Streptomyces natalensis]KIZ14884.1 TetR family transcriptional regulator [Streptomyces natalensis ATCC 27448]